MKMIKEDRLNFEEDYLLKNDLNHLLMKEMSVKTNSALERFPRY